MRNTLLPFLCLLLACPTLSYSQGMFAGNAAHTGEVAGSGPRSLKGVKWTFKTGGSVISSPVVAEGIVFFGSDDRHVYAVDLKTGAKKWQFKTEGPVRSTPAVASGAVFFGSYDGKVYALDAATGSLRWSFSTGGERRFEAKGLHGMKPATQTMADFWDVYASSAVVERGSVYIGSGDGNVYALDTATGELRWKFATGGVVHSSPACVNGTVYIGSWDTHLYALDAATGAEKWRFKTDEDPQAHNQTGIQSSPAVKDGVVYFGCRDANLYAVDAESGKERWKFSIKPTWINATPSLHGGVAYVGSSIPTHFFGVDVATGKESLKLPAEMIVFGSAVIADGYAYFGSFSGTVYALDLAKGQYAWQFQTEARRADVRKVFGPEGKIDFAALGGSEYYDQSHHFSDNLLALGSFIGSPTVADGVLLIGSADGHVYALE